MIGWETLPERLLRDDRDLTLPDVLQIQHMLGQKPHEAGAARRQMIAGVPVDRRGVEAVPRLVIGGGLDRAVPADESERLAEWLDAEYEPYGAHSHYGLVVGENSYQQVADGIRELPRRQPPVGRPGPCARAAALSGIIPTRDAAFV